MRPAGTSLIACVLVAWCALAAGPGGTTVSPHPLTYDGRAPDAPWREAARQRIDAHRKALLTVQVADTDGNPLEGARVSIRMRRSVFPFGSALSEDHLFPDVETEDTRQYRGHAARLFNAATLEDGLRWPEWLNPVRHERTMRSIDWIEGQGMELFGPNLIWPDWKWCPPEVQALADDPAAVDEAIRAHISDELTALRGRASRWVVVNEPTSNHEITDALGPDAIPQWFRWAHEADPDLQLYINDWGILATTWGVQYEHEPYRDAYEATIRTVLESGAPIHGIGMQCHFAARDETFDLLPPTRILEVLDRFSQFGLPIQITELDVHTMDERLQADYMRDFLTVAFSHPAVSGIMMWGFWSGRHWRPDAAMFRQDWSAKPVAEEWHRLVHDEWRTCDEATTDARGEATFSGFLGEYSVEAYWQESVTTTTATLGPGGAQLRIKR